MTCVKQPSHYEIAGIGDKLHLRHDVAFIFIGLCFRPAFFRPWKNEAAPRPTPGYDLFVITCVWPITP